MSALRRRIFRRSGLILLSVGFLFPPSPIIRPAIAGNVVDQEAQLHSMQQIAENFLGQLGIVQQIDIAIAANESRLVSVRRVGANGDRFVLTFDRAFLALLSEEEIRAVIAHELGHIWIFTHHPYLQTEELANRKALLLVSAESLEKAYTRVEHCGGVRQALPQAAAAPAGAQTTVRGANASN